jgi:SAM-dependent methyltransferase
VSIAAEVPTAPPPPSRAELLAARAKQRVRLLVGRDDREHGRVRRRLANKFLTGTGVEIGALHMPLQVPKDVTVRYVDRMSVAGLRAHYPELRTCALVDPDVIDDGERLGTLEAASQDFVIANHFIEHTEDPIGTLANHLRVLRPGGVIYMAVPDKRFTFDRDRPVTELSHLLRDHEEGPAWSRRGHFEECARIIERTPEDEVAARAAELDAEDFSIHFHTWTPGSFLTMLVHARDALGFGFDIEALERQGHEFIVILRRT